MLNKQRNVLLATKFGVPRIRPDLLTNSYLVGRLEEATTQELVLVRTLAGFGNTTLPLLCYMFTPIERLLLWRKASIK